MYISKKRTRLMITKKNLNEIIKILRLAKIESIILYGSQITGRANTYSDMDLLVTIKKLSTKTTKKLCWAKKELENKIGIKISLNIHTEDELNPILKSKDVFIHKNRSELLIYKYKYHYLCLYGKNPFLAFNNPSQKQLRKEAIKILLSFSYNLKKYLLNSNLVPNSEREFIRLPFISLEYIAAFYGYIAIDKYDALKYLKKHKLINSKQILLLKKILNKNGITLKEKIKIIDFIDFNRNLLLDKYLKFSQSDIRYVNGKIKSTWDLRYPQAVSMAIIKRGNKILLVKRTPNDYLYPNKWTLPGGYLNKNETFYNCIKRELFEETGLINNNITPLFYNKKICTKRVAIGCFLISINKKTIKLSEHSEFKFLSPDKLNMSEITPESEKILTKYFNL